MKAPDKGDGSEVVGFDGSWLTASLSLLQDAVGGLQFCIVMTENVGGNV